MWRTLAEFDAHLIDRIFQPASDWLEDVTGWSCFRWSALAYELAVLVTLILLGLRLSREGSLSGPSWLGFSVIIGFWQYMAWRSLNRDKRRAVLNEFRVTESFTRVFWIGCLTLDAILSIPFAHDVDVSATRSGMELARGVTVVIGFYFAACRKGGGGFRVPRMAPVGSTN